MTQRNQTIPPARTSSITTGSIVPENVRREFLAFELAAETYALPLDAVREILMPQPITGVPRSGADVLGIISVRGRVTTVLDLRRRLRLTGTTDPTLSRVLLVDSGIEVIGLVVDRVFQVYRLGIDEVELATTIGGDTADYVMGIGRPRAGRWSSKLGRDGRDAPESAVTSADQEVLLILLEPAPLLRR